LEVRLARSPDDVEQALRLRERVFNGEQGVPVEADRDGRDPEAVHVVAVEGGRVVGTCRLLLRGDVARLGRLAVARARRGQGIGAAVLREAERAALDAGVRAIELHAQLGARALYARAGYRPRGRRFVEEGIDHIRMEKRLA
jgi:predicted GNAT family N-acyltransferase